MCVRASACFSTLPVTVPGLLLCACVCPLSDMCPPHGPTLPLSGSVAPTPPPQPQQIPRSVGHGWGLVWARQRPWPDRFVCFATALWFACVVDLRSLRSRVAITLGPCTAIPPCRRVLPCAEVVAAVLVVVLVVEQPVRRDPARRVVGTLGVASHQPVVGPEPARRHQPLPPPPQPHLPRLAPRLQEVRA